MFFRYHEEWFIFFKQVCDYKEDCPMGNDEVVCATCNFEEASSCGWAAQGSINDPLIYRWGLFHIGKYHIFLKTFIS